VTTAARGPGGPGRPGRPGGPGGPGRPGGPPRQLGAARTAAAAGLLAAACVVWSALPPAAGGIATAILAAAIACAVLSVISLALGLAPAEPSDFLSPAASAARSLADLVRGLPWAEGMVVAVLVLEALHRSRPWQTGLLGVAVVAYLFATHLAESRAPASVLRPQAPLIAAGLGLLLLAVGAAMLPAGTGSPAVLLAVFAALGAVVVGSLALPVRPRGPAP
jgi:hypothetical protein